MTKSPLKTALLAGSSQGPPGGALEFSIFGQGP